jgi:hypothetical protein
VKSDFPVIDIRINNEGTILVIDGGWMGRWVSASGGSS